MGLVVVLHLWKDKDSGNQAQLKRRGKALRYRRLQFSSVAQSCRTLCVPMDCSTPGLPVHHQLPELTQTHVHRRLTSCYRFSEVLLCVLLHVIACCVCTIVVCVLLSMCVIVHVFPRPQITFLNNHCFFSLLREVVAPGLALG